jgi:hypothetical protein
MSNLIIYNKSDQAPQFIQFDLSYINENCNNIYNYLKDFYKYEDEDNNFDRIIDFLNLEISNISNISNITNISNIIDDINIIKNYYYDEINKIDDIIVKNNRIKQLLYFFVDNNYKNNYFEIQ